MISHKAFIVIFTVTQLFEINHIKNSDVGIFGDKKKGARKRRLEKDLLIHNRPGNINNRSEYSRWECDLMIFKKRVSNQT